MHIQGFLVATLALAACGGQVDDGAVDEQGESFSSYNLRLDGAYRNTDGKGHYERIAIKDDGTYLGRTSAGEERGSYTLYKPWIGAGQLTLTPTHPPGPPVLYYTSLAWFGGRLEMTTGKVKAKYQQLSTGYCGIDTDCNGQPFDRQQVTCPPGQGDMNVCTTLGTCTNQCVVEVPPMGPPTPPPPL